jgi:hypothetical protein
LFVLSEVRFSVGAMRELSCVLAFAVFRCLLMERFQIQIAGHHRISLGWRIQAHDFAGSPETSHVMAAFTAGTVGCDNTRASV